MDRRGSNLSRRVAGLVLAAGLVASGTVAAETIGVEPGSGGLAAAIAAAAPGDIVRLRAGTHAGPVTVDRAITLTGDPGAVIDGGGHGKVVVITAPGVVIRDVTIRGSGEKLETEDSGIFVEPTAAGAVIEGNRLQRNLIGIYLKGPENAIVRGNEIIGRQDLRMNERGNGVQLWNTPGSRVLDNDIRYGRDGIFVTTSKRNVFSGNRFRDLRFAVHYMYTDDSEISGNVSVGNHVGYALMFSHRLEVRENVSRGDRDRGILLNYANSSLIEGNVVEDGGEKCVFIYNSNKNRFSRNRFEGCDIGVHFTAGSEGNDITGNAFIGNRTQVKYVGTRWLEWSEDGRGNYWSDNPAFDLNGDGIADAPYRPNDLVDRVVWSYPLAKLLLNSPGVQVLRWAQSRFPALHPGGVVDSAPLMQPPGITVPSFGEARS
jgi:nitrous oxidase accessory protein